jgi:hypothetical protein
MVSAISTMSSIVQRLSEIPAAIAGVTRPRGMSIIAKQEGERGATANDAPSKSQINPVNRGAAVSV